METRKFLKNDYPLLKIQKLNSTPNNNKIKLNSLTISPKNQECNFEKMTYSSYFKNFNLNKNLSQFNDKDSSLSPGIKLGNMLMRSSFNSNNDYFMEEFNLSPRASKLVYPKEDENNTFNYFEANETDNISSDSESSIIKKNNNHSDGEVNENLTKNSYNINLKNGK